MISLSVLLVVAETTVVPRRLHLIGALGGMGAANSAEGDVDVQVSELISERMAYASHMRAKANRVRMIALEAAQSTVLAARREPGQDPAIVDQVLRDIDRMLIAATAQR